MRHFTLAAVLGASLLAMPIPAAQAQDALGGAIVGAGTGALIGGAVGGGRGAATGAIIGGATGAAVGANARGYRGERRCWINRYGERVCRYRNY